MIASRRQSPHTTPIDSEITRLLRAWQGGDHDAYRRVSSLLYVGLKRRAGQCLRGERADDAIQATALVHEAFIRLAPAGPVDWQDRLHFLAVATRTMRRVRVDLVRRGAASKRGARPVHVTLDSRIPRSEPDVVDALALDTALQKLATLDERRVRVVELRYFGGLTVEETAQVLHVSPDTVARDWRLARAWLRRELGTPSAR